MTEPSGYHTNTTHIHSKDTNQPLSHTHTHTQTHTCIHTHWHAHTHAPNTHTRTNSYQFQTNELKRKLSNLVIITIVCNAWHTVNEKNTCVRKYLSEKVHTHNACMHRHTCMHTQHTHCKIQNPPLPQVYALSCLTSACPNFSSNILDYNDPFSTSPNRLIHHHIMPKSLQIQTYCSTWQTTGNVTKVSFRFLSFPYTVGPLWEAFGISGSWKLILCECGNWHWNNHSIKLNCFVPSVSYNFQQTLLGNFFWFFKLCWPYGNISAQELTRREGGVEER